VPTAVQIAERAGYSVRSIFERFPDLGALRLAATDHAIAEGRAQGALRDLDADRATRLRSQVESRGQGCERWLPLWRVLSTNPTESSELQERIRLIRQLVTMRMEFMFKPELSTLSDTERRKTLLALESICDYESWGRMRELYGLSFEEACGVWIRAMDGLLPPTPAAS
jgi:AcrR family transcriptional regulator